MKFKDFVNDRTVINESLNVSEQEISRAITKHINDSVAVDAETLAFDLLKVMSSAISSSKYKHHAELVSAVKYYAKSL
jgi:hypothetical protein